MQGWQVTRDAIDPSHCGTGKPVQMVNFEYFCIPAADLLAGQAGMGANPQMAMYMASMYMAQQQAMGMQFPFMGMPGMMPGMGYPPMTGMMPGMMPGFSPMPGMMPGMMPGAFPGMMGSPEYVAYYQKMMEAQAAAMAAMGAASGGQGPGEDGDALEGDRRRDGSHHDGGAMGLSDGSPMRRRDLSSDQQRGGGSDSPVRREPGRSGDGMGGGGGGSGRKNSRREDDKRLDPVLEEFKNNKTKRFEFAVGMEAIDLEWSTSPPHGS